MKSLRTNIFLGIMVFVLLVFGYEIFTEFLANHSYYNDMFANWKNWKIFIWSVVSCVFPIGYLLLNKKFKLKKFLICLLLGLLVFSVAHVFLKAGIFGTNALLMLLFNTILIFAIGVYMILGSFSVGLFIENKFIKFRRESWQEMLIIFGLGLGVLLVLFRFLILFGVFYSLITWILFAGLGVMIYLQKSRFKVYGKLINGIFSKFTRSEILGNPWTIVGLILLIISIIYYYYGFNLSFIPYSTAWDANHAYMYYPKVWALNNGVFWTGGLGGYAVNIWHTFISIWFSLIKGIESRFWLSKDNIAVSMNFLSGMFVLIFGLGLIKEFIGYIGTKIKNLSSNVLELGFNVGWLGLLLWLTSGMGAFLVFVDNKTDLGVMSMTILAVLSGIIFIKYIKDHKESGKKLHKETIKYIIISAFLFVMAFLSKQTALNDIVIFVLILIGLWFGILFTLGGGIFMVGLVAKLGIANADDMVSTYSSFPEIMMIIGGVIVVIGIVNLILKFRNKSVLNNFKRSISYIGIWLASFLILVLALKGTVLLYGRLLNGNFDFKSYSKSILLGNNIQKIQLADNGNTNNLSDEAVLSKDACLKTDFTETQLEKNLKDAIVKNEDVGRYVGYGWKQFSNQKKLYLGKGILHTIYNKKGKCYSIKKDAKLMCENQDAIKSFDYDKLISLEEKLDKDTEGYNLVNVAIESFEQKGYSKTDSNLDKKMRSEIINMKQYYQNNSVYKDMNGTLFVPYKNIVLLNITYNRSLQNHSSYYTDIGWIWMFVYVFVLMGLIYGLFQIKNKMLLVLSVSTIIGWAIWWIIGGAILWYGIGLIMWSVVLISIYISYLFDDVDNDNTKILFYLMIGIFALWALLQLMFNFIRISYQGAKGPFVYYKTSVGKVGNFDKTLKYNEEIKYGYNEKDVFDLQFPHYNKFIEHVKDRKDEDGILVAGTYLSYFLDNQTNLKYNGMLAWFWEMISDNDTCKSYQRLRNANLKYLVIDPNIGTVVMGEGNESLFNRFFAKINQVNGKIEEHGSISMLVQMWKDGYINLFSTNNLGAKYAFTLSDEQLSSYFQTTNQEDIDLIRSRLVIMRYFNNKTMYDFVYNMFDFRIQNGQAIGDIADIYGKIINEQKVVNVASMWMNQVDKNELSKLIGDLTKDERYVLYQYILFYTMRNNNQNQYQQQLSDLINKMSIGATSQLMIFELID